MPPIKRACAILVFISGQKRGVFGGTKREPRRRYAIDAAFGHMKINGHLARRYLKGAAGGRHRHPQCGRLLSPPRSNG